MAHVLRAEAGLAQIGHNQPPSSIDDYFGPRRDGGIGDGGNHILACGKYPVAKLLHIIPAKWIAQAEQNQLRASCCRHPENHEIAAFYTSDADERKKTPDLYIMYCGCGRKHRTFCVGSSGPGHERPFWDVK